MHIKARGVIINNEGHLFLGKLKKQGFFCLPGGTVEEGELVVDCLRRELHEELGIDVEIGKLLYVHNFLNKEKDQTVVDIRYHIPYSKVFDSIDLGNASHGFENTEVGFYDIDTLSGIIQPENIKEIISGF